MAYLKSIAIIFLCLTTVVFAAENDKFPPISGEIYGQASAGIKSISVNQQHVSFDRDLNFRTTVNLAAGEKYLTLNFNYGDFQILRKFLVLRSPQTKTFKIFVPKEKTEKDIFPPGEEATKKEATKEVIPETPVEEERPVIEKTFTASEELPEEESAMAVKKKPTFIKKTPPPHPRKKFVSHKKKSILHKKPVKKEKWVQKKKPVKPKAVKLKAVKSKAAKKPKVIEYIYVWEFDRGKLLITKKVYGKYYAEIYVPDLNKWYDFKMLSRQELREIISENTKK